MTDSSEWNLSPDDASGHASGDATVVDPVDSDGVVTPNTGGGTAVQQPMFGGYSGSYAGIDNAWYSSDGFVYDAGGNRIGTH